MAARAASSPWCSRTATRACGACSSEFCDLLQRRRHGARRRRLCRRRGADRRRQPRHAGRACSAPAIATCIRCRRPGDLPGLIWQIARPGDVVVCLGAGNITAWAHALPGQLEETRRAAGSARIANGNELPADRTPHDGARAAHAHLIDRLAKPRGRLAADAPLGARPGSASAARRRCCSARPTPTISALPDGTAGRRAGDGDRRRLEPAGARRRHRRRGDPPGRGFADIEVEGSERRGRRRRARSQRGAHRRASRRWRASSSSPASPAPSAARCA